jgi:hypothetical protein
MKKIAAVVLLAGFVASAFAEDSMRPGLWQSTMNIDMPQGMPQMSPEQLAKMKQMGIELPFGHPISTQVCVTPEEAAKRSSYKPHMRPEDQCQMKDYVNTGGHYSGTMECAGDMKGTGHFTADRSGDTGYSGSWDFNGTSRGRPMQMHATFQGQFLAADCGAVKPIETHQP